MSVTAATHIPAPVGQPTVSPVVATVIPSVARTIALAARAMVARSSAWTGLVTVTALEMPSTADVFVVVGVDTSSPAPAEPDGLGDGVLSNGAVGGGLLGARVLGMK